MNFLKRAAKKIIKEGKKGLDHATGKHKIKKQYHRSLKQSYALETEMRLKLYLQLYAEQSKIEEYRQATQLLTQEEAEQFLKEKTAISTLAAEKKAAFKAGCEKIENNMQLIRAALYACMTGDLEILEWTEWL